MQTPFFHAGLAFLYICLVASLMFYGQPFVREEDAVIMPIAALSLLTLSTSVMSYLFFYRPLLLILEGKKDVALQFFLKTIGYFALATCFVFIGMFLLKYL
jgi:hypothetical protein